LVATATLGHLLYGEVHLSSATSLLLGALPGVYLGARLSTRGPAAVSGTGHATRPSGRRIVPVSTRESPLTENVRICATSREFR
ncbi:MAG TPA: hypothetical protein VK784_10455, partial [Pseudonocardiaceae bacterium]|nr:hypothetical protein [Pseudonocardiaceae bacterium]